MVSHTEVQKAIGSCQNDSAVGQDSITSRMVAAVHCTLPNELPVIFSHLLMHGVFPVVWKTAKWVPILKPGKMDSLNHKNLQPVSLLPCLNKTFQKVLPNILAKAAKETGAIIKQQMRSRADLSCIDALRVTLNQVTTWLDVAMQDLSSKR